MMGGIQFVFLWTDILIYLLVVSISGFIFHTLKHEHLKAPWKIVFQRRLGMAAFLILMSYVCIGLLDSVHYKRGDDPEIISLLDDLVGGLRTREEKTYSAPFASYLFSKETIQLSDGKSVRDFPRLKFGGAHLADPQRDKWTDIAKRILQAVLVAVFIWLMFIYLLVIWLGRRKQQSWKLTLDNLWRGQDEALPWKVILVTLGLLLLLFVLVVQLSPYYHIFGTDKVGEDVLYQSLKSIRTGLVIGTLTTLFMLPFAVSLGIMAGYFRGWVDDVIQYLYTTLSSIPGVLLIAAAVLMLQVYMSNHPEQFGDVISRADARLLFLCLILGVTSWTGLCRLLRGEAMKISQVEYIQASHAFGTRHLRVISRHILPNVMHIVLISVVLDFSGLVLAEAVLSYVGVGVDPTTNSWGNMINSARLEMAREPMVWWSLIAAFSFMFILVLAANLFSDAVRDAFDPRMQRR
jgi:peptide/nickel transport system permease protein